MITSRAGREPYDRPRPWTSEMIRYLTEHISLQIGIMLTFVSLALFCELLVRTKKADASPGHGILTCLTWRAACR